MKQMPLSTSSQIKHYRRSKRNNPYTFPSILDSLYLTVEVVKSVFSLHVNQLALVA